MRVQNDSDGLRRSHSQNQIHLPSQDLLGLSLHPIDPIDGSPTEKPPPPADPVKSDNPSSDSPFNHSSSFIADFSKNNPTLSSTLQPLDTSATSKGEKIR